MYQTTTSFNDLEKELPALISRKELVKALGGLYSAGYLANLDSSGEGPDKVVVGRKVMYARASVIQWLKARVR